MVTATPLVQFREVRRPRHTLLFAALLTLVALMGSATAAGAGSSTSAGDNQYVDPLTATSTTSSTSAEPPSTAPSSSAPAVGEPKPEGAAASAMHDSRYFAGRQLPYTGFDVRLCVAVGIGLLGCGLILRRVVHRD